MRRDGTMRCEQIRDLLSPYIDHMTDEKENKLIAAHLMDCPECRQELEGIKTMCVFLGKLEPPTIPARFSEDLHKRLLEEKTTVFVAKEARRPKRSGWIAAGAAGLAISVGIYASSVLPLGTLVASWQDKSKEQPEKPKVAIEDILRSFTGWGTDKNETPPVDIANNQGDVERTPKNNEAAPPNSEQPEGNQPNPGINEQVDMTPRFTDEYATKMLVNDANKAANQVIDIAQSNGAKYTVSNGSTMQALSAANAKEISIQTDKDKAQNLLKQLGGVGEISPAIFNQIELTKEYADVEEQINVTERLIKELEAKDKGKAGNQQLGELKEHLASCKDKQEQLLAQENIVTIKVIIEEEVIHQ